MQQIIGGVDQALAESIAALRNQIEINWQNIRILFFAAFRGKNANTAGDCIVFRRSQAAATGRARNRIGDIAQETNVQIRCFLRSKRWLQSCFHSAGPRRFCHDRECTKAC